MTKASKPFYQKFIFVGRQIFEFFETQLKRLIPRKIYLQKTKKKGLQFLAYVPMFQLVYLPLCQGFSCKVVSKTNIIRLCHLFLIQHTKSRPSR